jgi:DNA mismatch endonuclease (patch repair protein)
MADRMTAAQRSYCMSRIRDRDTKPELIVRSMVHAMGYRFQLQRKDIEGRPDLALIGGRKLIFVHGCFWHRHHCRWGQVEPKTNAAFWRDKREANAARDARVVRRLRRQGWGVLTAWECELRDPGKLRGRLERFLAPRA